MSGVMSAFRYSWIKVGRLFCVVEIRDKASLRCRFLSPMDYS